MLRWFRTLVDSQFEKRFAEPAPPRDFDHLYQLAPGELEARANGGDGKAAYVLGDLHDKGQAGESADFQEALRWYRRAEKLGDGDALNNLGSMHHHGELLEKDLDKARDYYERAAKAGCPVGAGNLGKMYLEGTGGLPVRLRRARRLLRRGVRGGDPNAMLSLGYAYDVGKLSTKPLRALYFYRKATSHGVPGAFLNLGLKYWNGEHVRRNEAKAIELFREASALGNARAANFVGVAYRDGRGCERNSRLAIDAFMIGADRGSESASENRDDLLEAEPALHVDRGDRLRRFGRPEEAIAAYETGLPHVEADPDAPELRALHGRSGLAYCLHVTGRIEEARAINAAVLPRLEALNGEEDFSTRLVRGNLADNLFRLGNLDAALPLAERQLAISQKLEDLDRIYDDLNFVAILNFEKGLFQEADALLRRRIEVAKELGDEDMEHAARDQHASMLSASMARGGESEQRPM